MTLIRTGFHMADLVLGIKHELNSLMIPEVGGTSLHAGIFETRGEEVCGFFSFLSRSICLFILLY